MTTARLDVWIWVLIFGGLLVAGLGIALLQGGAAWGWPVVGAGALAVVVGVVLIWVRSRMPDHPPRP